MSSFAIEIYLNNCQQNVSQKRKQIVWTVKNIKQEINKNIYLIYKNYQNNILECHYLLRYLAKKLNTLFYTGISGL